MKDSSQQLIELDDDYLSKVITILPGYNPYDDAEGYHFDPDAARRAITFFAEAIIHTKGSLAKKPYILEPHEQAITANIFGWKNDDGLRRYREVFYYVPRKNSKTTWAAGLALYIFFSDGEYGAECYCAAAEKAQATLLFQQCEMMIRHCKSMRQRVKIYTATKAIIWSEQNSTFRAISAEAGSKHGYNSHLVLIDELHAQKNRELVDVLLTSTGSRRQPLIVYTTTADYDHPSICNEKYKYACQVRDEVIDDATFLPVIYEAKIGDDWTSPKVWEKCNPNLGKSVSTAYIERECERAKVIPAYENTFKRLHLNIVTETNVCWIPLEMWDKCYGVVDRAELEEQICYAGLDLSSTTDISALILDFPQDDGSHTWLLSAWIPEDNIHDRERRDKVPYSAWINSGYLNTTPGNVIDYEFIRKEISDLNETYHIKQIAIDRWNATELSTQLMGDGFDVVPFGQGFASMSAPSKELQRLIVGGKLNHGGNPLLRWAISNVAIELDAAGNIKPSKKKSTERIDPIVAGIMAIGVASIDQKDSDCSVYDTRGLLTI